MSAGRMRSAAARTVVWAALMAALVGLYVGRNVVAAGARIDDGASDFAHYHQAARAVLAGASPYSVRGFLYPPPALLPVLPFAALDGPAARAAWFWASQALLLAAALATWSGLGRGRGAALAVVAAWALTGTVAENLVLGQINVVLLLLLAVAMGAGSASTSAAFVGAAAAVKIWPGLLLAAPLAARRRRAVVIGVAWAAGLLVVSTSLLALFLPPPHSPPGNGAWAGTPAFLNLSLPATALRLLSLPSDWRSLPGSWLTGNRLEDVRLGGTEIAVSLAVATAVVAFGLVAVWRAARRGVPAVALSAALVAVALAAAPVSWYHYRLLHLPGIAWLLLRLGGRRDVGAVALLGALVAVVGWSHLAWTAAAGVAAEPWFVLARGALVPALELVLAAWYLREATEPA